jgi:membrane fusion protein, multidrug efflux system
MQRKRVIVGLAAAIAVAGAGALALEQIGTTKTAVQATAARPAVPVIASAVASHDVPIYLRGLGSVLAYNTVTIRSQVQGQIETIAFSEGQTVHAGDLLAQIDPRPFQAQLDQATANRDRDQAQFANAQANLARYTPLLAKGFATPQLVDTQKAQVAQLAAAVKSDQAVMENAQVQLDYTRITAPFDGVTGIRQIDQGNIIHPTDANGLVVITQIEPISVIFTLPQTDLPAIQQRMANGPLSVLAFAQDDKTELDQGQLELVDNLIDQTTGTVRLKATFPNKAHKLWPGEFVNIRLLLDTRHDGLTVAASVVQRGPQGSYAYVIGPDGTVASRPITVAQITNGQALIDSGLAAGEQVVVDGQYKLQPGSRVTVLHGKAAQQAISQSAQQADIP